MSRTDMRARGAAMVAALTLVASVVLGATALSTHAQQPAARRVATALSGGLAVSGNHLVNTATGQTVVPRGVNRSGTEYACIQGWGIFDGPSDAASVQAISGWGATIVRVPLNEDCWLNINGVNSAYAGSNYINAVQSYVNLLHQNGMYAELSLIWGAPGTQKATYQPAAPDADHSPAMWAGVASAFKSDPNVILAPWGETTVPWPCFESGGSCGGTGYTVAGMQQAVTVMRQNGYHGVISIPCIDYANDCNDNSSYFGGQGGGDWLSHEPSDPDHNLIAEAHIYGKNTCDTTACLDATIGNQVGSVPFIFGETGETYDGSDCNNSSSYTSTFMTWADAHGVGYEAWTWDTWGSCNLSLITSYTGIPYGVYGTYVQQHLLSFGGGQPPTPTPTGTTPPTSTATPTNTPTNTPTPSPTNTPSPTATPTNSPTPAPSPTGTPSPTPAPSGGIVNGDFATCDLTGWTFTGAAERVENTDYHAAPCAVQLGTANAASNGTSRVRQSFTAPAGATTLTLWYESHNPLANDTTWDYSQATIKDVTTGVTTRLFKTAPYTAAWRVVSWPHVVAGHTYTLTLTNYSSGLAGSDTYWTSFDDVALSGATGAVAPLAPPGGNGG